MSAFWSFCGMGPYVIAIPYDTTRTGPFVWAQQGQNNGFVQPNNAPGGRIGSIVGQFLMLGDVLQAQQQVIGTGDGVKTSFTFGLNNLPMLSAGSVYDQFGAFAGTFQNGQIVGSGTLVPSTVNYETGNITVSLSAAAAAGDQIFANYTQAAPYRVQWGAIGDPNNWPIPLTANAIAFQSGFEDLQVDLGPVKFIAGFPLYGVIFQEFGITRANYVGGNVVFSFSTYARNGGIVARGAGCVAGQLVYFLSQDGFKVTDGNSMQPIGTDAQNSLGIDNWFFAHVNTSALEAIRCAYDSTTRNVYFAIPTGTNTLPDTLLSFNPIAQRWTKSVIPTELIWTDTNASNVPGSVLRLALFTQAHQASLLNGNTLNGYLETCDLMDADANVRYNFGVRPNIACMDTPMAMVGVRNSLQDNVSYSVPTVPDSFSRIVPLMMEGVYTRVNVSSSAGSSFNGATLYQQPGGPV